MAAMAAAIAVAVVSATEPDPLAPRLLLGVIGLLLVLTYSWWTVLRGLLVIQPLYVALSALAGPPGMGLAALDDAVLTTALTLPAAVFVQVLVRTVQALDRVRRERVDAELAGSLESRWPRRRPTRAAFCTTRSSAP